MNPIFSQFLAAVQGTEISMECRYLCAWICSYMSVNHIGGTYGNCIFSFSRLLMLISITAGQRCTPSSGESGSRFPHILDSLCCYVSFDLSGPDPVKWNLKVVVVCICLAAREAEPGLKTLSGHLCFFFRGLAVYFISSIIDGGFVVWFYSYFPYSQDQQLCPRYDWQMFPLILQTIKFLLCRTFEIPCSQVRWFLELFPVLLELCSERSSP